MKEKNSRKDFLDELSLLLPPERIERAKINADKEIFKIRLSELRKNMGYKQEQIKSFSQSSISRLETRKDMKVSTLIGYLEDIGMGMEIKVYPKKRHNKSKEFTLLKV
jgi:hypothetical protein